MSLTSESGTNTLLFPMLMIIRTLSRFEFFTKCKYEVIVSVIKWNLFSNLIAVAESAV